MKRKAKVKLPPMPEFWRNLGHMGIAGDFNVVEPAAYVKTASLARARALRDAVNVARRHLAGVKRAETPLERLPGPLTKTRVARAIYNELRRLK